MTTSQRWILVLAALAAFMTALDTLVVTTALSTIRLDLGASVEELEWTVNAYNLSFAVLLMTAAGVGDRFGRRRLFVAGIGLFALASAACAVAPSVEALIAARAVQGVGAALVTTLALTLISTAFPPERRGAALGIFFAVNGLAVAGGPLVGGAVTEGIAWEWIFWLNVPIGLALIPLVLARVPESRGPDSALDLRGLALVTSGVLGVVWALVRGNAAGWGSAEVLVTLLGGVALLAAFVAWQLRAPAPMLPMHFFRSRAFSAGNAAIFCAVGGPVLRRVLHVPVPAGGPGQRSAGRRPAAAAVDGHAVLRGAGGGHAGGPLRRAPVPDRRPAAPGRGPGLDRAASPSRACPTRS